jgi:hypothetical protein
MNSSFMKGPRMMAALPINFVVFHLHISLQVLGQMLQEE